VRFRRSIEGNYRLAIALAKSEIIIANAYFLPGVQLQRALLRAARRGVRITLLLQGKYEYFMQYHASRAVYRMMLGAGITIIEYEASFLHAKVAVMDADGGALATVGSSNLDPLSLLLAREANVFVRDDAFAAELRGHLLDAAARGRRVEPDEHKHWPLVTRGLNWVAYLLMRALVSASGKRY
jgi:cardiolipin synthase